MSPLQSHSCYSPTKSTISWPPLRMERRIMGIRPPSNRHRSRSRKHDLRASCPRIRGAAGWIAPPAANMPLVTTSVHPDNSITIRLFLPGRILPLRSARRPVRGDRPGTRFTPDTRPREELGYPLSPRQDDTAVVLFAGGRPGQITQSGGRSRRPDATVHGHLISLRSQASGGVTHLGTSPSGSRLVRTSGVRTHDRLPNLCLDDKPGLAILPRRSTRNPEPPMPSNAVMSS